MPYHGAFAARSTPYEERGHITSCMMWPRCIQGLPSVAAVVIIRCALP
ncbi:hypothetical protein BIFGAL_03714 [Bifidobacterium gallicum DSM 20093 = LMG 11596]|uniref:Uncharacterized protein n=1 Tax=Bifidobacterium gallicum DSM 20093 = LMG 11596 TaxID=561180 RepID=D1NV33_9BIFI|nr:hypothetical protein BIFGAL_03714 [Bifidobacterium gallicum DSM 20093 = LMG 11596]